jgi:hypothetical protein
VRGARTAVLALPPVGLRHLKVNEVAPGGADLVAEVGVRGDPGAYAQVAQPSGKRDRRRDAALRVDGEQQNVSHPMDATSASTDTNKVIIPNDFWFLSHPQP